MASAIIDGGKIINNNNKKGGKCSGPNHDLTPSFNIPYDKNRLVRSPQEVLDLLRKSAKA